MRQDISCLKAPPCVLVIFGASGDLTRRKLIPALFGLEKGNLLPEGFTIVGFGRSDMSDEAFRRAVSASLPADGPADAEAALTGQFCERLHYVSGRYDDEASLVRLHEKLSQIASRCGALRYLYYLALPPDVGEDLMRTLRGIEKHRLLMNDASPAIMVEKPFGHDLASAQRLNALLREMFQESDIYRIDHYIAKETVRNLLIFRFGNAVFEHLWNRKYIDNVQITAAESIGIEGRGAYYDQAGVVRDMVQNHVLQVLALVAMEAPLAGDAESVRDKKLEVFKSLRPIRADDCVFGQYEGYRDERNVAPNSATPTFAALRVFVDNWRWQGVPFYIRAGKALAKRVTEVAIQFKSVPVCVFEDTESCARLRPNVLTVRIQPDEGIRLSFCAKVPGREDLVTDANLDFRYADLGGRLADAYERVLLDSLRCKPTLFWRADSIEAAWRFVTPLLRNAGGTVPSYVPGSWGPGEAQEMPAQDGRSWIETY